MELTFENISAGSTLPDLDLLHIDAGGSDGLSADKNSAAAVAFRVKTNEFQAQYEAALKSGELTPVPYSYKHQFTEKHADFGVAMYAREMSVGKGAIIIGRIHKHPVVNVLLKGKLLVVSESGRRTVEAPCTYISEPGVKKIGYVLEDCTWLNVLMTDVVGEENLDLITSSHTAQSYGELGLADQAKKD